MHVTALSNHENTKLDNLTQFKFNFFLKIKILCNTCNKNIL